MHLFSYNSLIDQLYIRLIMCSPELSNQNIRRNLIDVILLYSRPQFLDEEGGVAPQGFVSGVQIPSVQ